MKVLVLGADGFIGRRVKELLSGNHEVYGSNRRADTHDGNNVYIDLLKRKTIAKVLKQLKPELVINCAGIVDNSEIAEQNPIFTSSLLEEAVASGLQFKRVIISGSAAEYGLVDEKNIPVDEDAPRNANAGYGLSKLQEVDLALSFHEKYGLPIVIARIFNPIGPGMRPKFLIPGILRQVNEVQAGKKRSIEVSRLDSRRDYVDVSDVASAIKILVEGQPEYRVYNIGSGKSTSNQELIELILKNSDLAHRPDIKETSDTKEPLVAIQADISRIHQELGWSPKISIEETIKNIVYDTR